ILADGISDDPANVTPASDCYTRPATTTPPIPAYTVCRGRGYVCTHNYAYFSTSATGDVGAARVNLAYDFKSIFSTLAVGDYTTETPAIAERVFINGTTTKNIVYTSSIGYPTYQGHLRAQDLDNCTDAG